MSRILVVDDVAALAEQYAYDLKRIGAHEVATAAGGVPELIRDGETGFFTPPGDAARLAERLIPLLRDASLRRAVGERAQAWAREQFALPRHVRIMSDIYENLARGH